jgi:hypothetical protein
MMVDALQGLLQGIFGSVVSAGVDPAQDRSDHRAAAALRRLSDFLGTQGHRLDAGAYRPEPGRSLGADSADRRRPEAVVEGSRHPDRSDKSVFLLAPMFAFAPALAAWAVVPFNDTLVLANVNASLLYIMSITSIGVYGIILSGWASNSKYAFLGGMRSAAQMISYEVAMGFSLVCVLMVSNSLNL